MTNSPGTDDTNGRITTWNIGAERLLGFSEAEAVGLEAAVIFTEEDRTTRVPERELTEAAAKGRAGDERWHVRKGGARFWGSGVMSAVRNADGSLRGFLKVLRDVATHQFGDPGSNFHADVHRNQVCLQRLVVWKVMPLGRYVPKLERYLLSPKNSSCRDCDLTPACRAEHWQQIEKKFSMPN